MGFICVVGWLIGRLVGWLVRLLQCAGAIVAAVALVLLRCKRSVLVIRGRTFEEHGC